MQPLNQHLLAHFERIEAMVKRFHQQGEHVAEPKLQIDQRLDRHEKAIETMAEWLVQAQTGFNANDAKGIKKILRGEKSERVEGSEHHQDSERQEQSGSEVSGSSDSED